jgi:putative flippase GtrA
MISRRFAKFLMAGGVAAVANFSSRIVFSHWMAYVSAIVLAYVVGMITAFVLNRLFVFNTATNSLGSQAWWFTLVNIAAVLQTIVISIVLADYVFPALGLKALRETIAHGFGVMIPAITSYIGHKYLSFRNA